MILEETALQFQEPKQVAETQSECDKKGNAPNEIKKQDVLDSRLCMQIFTSNAIRSEHNGV